VSDPSLPMSYGGPGQGPLPPGAPPPPAASWPSLPPQPPPRRSGFSIGSCLMALTLICSLGLNVVMFLMLLGSLGGGGGLTGDGTTERHVEGTSGSDHKIAVIPVYGVIASGSESLLGPNVDMVDKIIKDLRRVKDDKAVVAVILDVDSPGGGITDCDRIHHEIMKLRKDRPDLKFVSYMRSVAASGGYYVSAPCDRILASPTTVTGSIGVIMSFMNLQGLFEKVGVKEEVIKSGDHKDIGSMARPMTDEERAMLQAMLMEMYDRFVDVVAKGRRMDEKKVRLLADGRIYSALQAKANGLVDELGQFEDAVEAAKSLAGVKDANVIQYQRPPTFADLLRGESRVPSPEAAVVMSIQKIAGRRDGFYYLWSAGSDR
jgi:protease-4